MPESTLQRGWFVTKALLCACVAGAAGAEARANWYLNYTSATQYVSGFTKVPDFDQRRTALANLGAMYCVPTSGINWAVYFAHHGFPGILPGDEDYLHWQWSPAGYDTISATIDDLGDDMDTDPVKGTSGDDHVAGLQGWMSPHVTVMRCAFNATTSPSFDDIASWVRQGVPVTASVGWYEGVEPNITRNGGHAVSVVKVARNGSQRIIGFNDPADDSANLSAQSIFKRQEYACEARLFFLGGVPRAIDKVVGYGNGYIDAYTVMLPAHAFSKSSDSTRVRFERILRMPYDLEPPVKEIVAPSGALVTDVASAPFDPAAYFGTAAVSGGPGPRIYKYDYLNDIVLETDMAVFTDPKAMCTGRNGELYVADGNAVRCFDTSVDPEVQTGAVFFGQVWTLAYNDVTAEVIVLVGDKIFRLDSNLDPTGTPVTLPAGLTIVGERSIGASPVTGDLFVTSKGSPGVYYFPNSAPADSPLTTFSLIGSGQISEPKDLSIGDRDSLYISDNGVRKAFARNPGTGFWSLDPADPSHNKPAGENEKTARSRTNFDAATMVGPAYDDVLPTVFGASVAACLADLNDDFLVNGADLGVLLGAWGGSAGDLNGDGVTDGADLGLLLGSWGPCP